MGNLPGDFSSLQRDTQAQPHNLIDDTVSRAREWKESWREEQRRLPFEEKLRIVVSLLNGRRMHPRVLVRRPEDQPAPSAREDQE